MALPVLGKKTTTLAVESNIDDLQDLLEGFTPQIRKRVFARTLNRAARELRKRLRADAPKYTGNLRRSIRVSRVYGSSLFVGLRDRYYYKVLDYPSKRGAPMAPWFEASWGRHRSAISSIMRQEFAYAVDFEMGRMTAQFNARKRFR